MTDIPGDGTRGIAHAVGDEGPRRIAFIGLRRPGRLDVGRRGILAAADRLELHAREIREPHVGRVHHRRRGVPPAVVLRGGIGEVGHARIIEPELAEGFGRDGANQDSGLLQILALHRINDAVLAPSGSVIIRATVVVLLELPAIVVGVKDLREVLAADVVHTDDPAAPILGLGQSRQEHAR